MKKIKSKGTSLENRMEQILSSLSIEFQEQPKLTGNPDFRLLDHRIVIFCDSSFWHGRNPDDISGKNFKQNRVLWVKKLTQTKSRDAKVNLILKEMGWKVLRFWDDEILKTPTLCKERIQNAIKELK